MNSGYSFGDFQVVVQLSFKVYEKCQSSPRAELRNLAKDIGNSHVVVRNIHHFWESEKDRKRDFLIPQQNELKQLAEGAEEALKTMYEIQRKSKNLDTGDSSIESASWSKYILADIFGDIGSARDKLQYNTGNLALMYTVLTADALYDPSYEITNIQREILQYFKQQADITQVLVKTYRNLQDGEGILPAYSQVQKNGKHEDQAALTLDAAEKDLLAEGIEEEIILEHRDLIKEWLEMVILSVESEEDGSDASVQSFLGLIPGSEQNIPTTPLEQAQLIVPKWLDTVISEEDGEEKTDVYALPGNFIIPSVQQDIPADPPEQVQLNAPMRSASINTRASQSSAWTPNDAERMSDYAADLIVKVLRSKYSPSAGTHAFSLPLREAFRHLDWTKRGWLPRAVVKEQCHRASTKITNFILDRNEFAKTIEAESERSGPANNRIYESEFVNIVLLVRETYRSAIEKQSITNGLRLAAAEIIRWQGQQSKKAISQLWTIETRYRKVKNEAKIAADNFMIEPVTSFSHKFGGDITPLHFPLARNATNAIYIATEYCVTLVDGAFDNLRHFLKDWAAGEEAEVVEMLNTMKETAALFHRFKSPGKLGTYHWLDEFIDVASVIPFSHFSKLQSAPLDKAVTVVTNLWNVLDNILGLVSDLHYFPYNGGSLLPWREFRILDRARDLAAQASCILEQTGPFSHVEIWYHRDQEHRLSLFETRVLCEITTLNLRKEQQEAAESVQKCKISINWLRLSQLPKANAFRRPSTFVKAFCDEELVHRSEIVKSTTPAYQNFTVELVPSSMIKIEFYNETKTCEPFGSIEFSGRENVDFARGAEVHLEKTLSKSSIAAMLDVRPVEGERQPIPFLPPSTNETEKEEARRKLLELPLPAYIFSQSLPDGWEVRSNATAANPNGIYFWDLKNSEPTAILWHDPNQVIAKEVEHVPRDFSQNVLPVRYHFPEAFHIGTVN